MTLINKSSPNRKSELVFILDRSGSMAGLESDTIGGFNAMLQKQKDMPGEALVTTVLFDDEYELLFDRQSIHEVSLIGADDYFVRGSTALLDAIGKTINKMIAVQKHGGPSQRAEKVLFVITTDGLENASREYSPEQVRRMIEHQQTAFGWEFIFLGANIDAIATAAQIGIQANRAANYHADSAGTQMNFQAVHNAVCELRNGREIDENWKQSIDEDYHKRGKQSK